MAIAGAESAAAQTSADRVILTVHEKLLSHESNQEILMRMACIIKDNARHAGD
ncbi:hypothetical protein P5G89_00050 [Serratia nevei]|nr:hypothetical protein [Serratia nevei]